MIGFILLLLSFGCFASVLLPPERVFSFVLACIIHEAGHIIAAKAAGGRADAVRATPFRFSIAIGGLSDYRDEIIVALAGPLFNFISAICMLLLFGRDGYFFASVSFVVGALNLMPVYILDGGRAFEAAMNILLPSAISRRISAATSDILVFSLAMASAYRMLRVGDSFLLFLFSVLCMKRENENIHKM